MSKLIKLNRRTSRAIVRRSPNVFGNLLDAVLAVKVADDDASVPYLHSADLLRDKPRDYVLQ